MATTPPKPQTSETERPTTEVQAIMANIYAHALDEAKPQAIPGLSKQLKKDEG